MNKAKIWGLVLLAGLTLPTSLWAHALPNQPDASLPEKSRKSSQNNAQKGIDFSRIYEELNENYNTFNMLNKRLFQEANRETWTGRFKTRANRCSEIYEQNEKNLKFLEFYFKEGNLATNADYDSLFNYTLLSFKQGIDNPFLTEQSLNLLLDHYNGQKKKRASKIITCNYLLGEELLKIGNYGDPDSYSKALDHLLKCNALGTQFFPDVDTDLTRSFILYSFYKLGSYQLMNFGYISTQKQLELRDALIKLRNDPENLAIFNRSEPLRNLVSKILNAFDYRIVRYKVAPQWMHSNIKEVKYDEHETALNDSISEAYLLTLQEKHKNLTYEETLMRGFLRCRKGAIKVDTFLGKLEDYILSEMKDTRDFSYERMYRYFTTVYMLFAALDQSSLPEAEKCSKATFYCHNIGKFFTECQTRENAYKELVEWSYFASLPTVYKYLDKEMARTWTLTMGLMTNPINYVTSSYTADVVELITRGIIDHAPELLVGSLGTRTAQEVIDQKARIVSHIKSASLLHGLGRSRMPAVYFYRLNPYLPHESAMITNYPQHTKDFITCNNTLTKYQNLLLVNFHASEAEAQKEMESADDAPLIEILRLAHHLDGTHSENHESIYKHKDTKELIAWAHKHEGVYYRKALVDVIENTPELFAQLQNLNENQWEDKMYELYRWYFFKNEPEKNK